MANTTIAGLPTLTPISSCAAIPVCSGNVTYNVTVGNLKTFVNSNGTSNISIAIANANITVGVSGTANVIQWASTGEYVTGEISATGNISGNYIYGNGSQLTGVVAVGNASANTVGTVYGRTIPCNPASGNANVTSLGYNAGLTFQRANTTAIGFQAGQNSQGANAVAVGSSAGYNAQGANSVALGILAGYSQLGDSSIAIGYNASKLLGGGNTISIGRCAGQYQQGNNSVAIGFQASYNTQGSCSVAIGKSSATTGSNAVAIGRNTSVSANTGIAIGAAVNASNPGFYVSPIRCKTTAGGTPIALGYCTSSKEIVYGVSGNATPCARGTVFAVTNFNYCSCGNIGRTSLGYYAGRTNQGPYATAIGYGTGSNQSEDAVALGHAAGGTQGVRAIAVGYIAGGTTQGQNSVAVGGQAGQISQSACAISIGYLTGRYYQGYSGIAIGYNTAYSNQSSYTVAIGYNTAGNLQGQNSIAIGRCAANTSQGNASIAIGYNAGKTSQGANAIAIGNNAGQNTQATNSIAIGSCVAAPNSGLYISPIRCASTAGGSPGVLGYCSTTKEISYGVTATVAGIISGTSNVNIASANSNVTFGVAGTNNVAVFATTGEYVTGIISASGNVIGSNFGTAGLVSASGAVIGASLLGTIVSASGSVLTAGILSSTGNVQAGNIRTAGQMTATGNITGGNILTNGSISVAGNATIVGDLTVSGNVTFIDADVIVTNDLYIQLANNQSTYANINNSGLAVGPIGNVLTYWQYKNASNSWSTNVAISATANVIGGNILTAGIMSSTGNVTGGNILTAGFISATGNITAIAATGSATSAANSVGYLGIPINSQSANYTLTISDQSKQVYFTAGAVLTVPSNASVAFPIGTSIGVIAPASNVTVTISTDTMYLMGNTGGLTGNRVITAYGGATLTKVAATTWYIGGAGVV